VKVRNTKISTSPYISTLKDLAMEIQPRSIEELGLTRWILMQKYTLIRKECYGLLILREEYHSLRT
jgi:hypothetical protein